MEPVVEKEFTAFGGLFQTIINDLKNSAPVWEDFLMKASKFHSQLRATVVTSGSFLDSFQKIADMATNTRGATKEIGSALTRLCLRQRSVESKLKTLSNSLQEALILPLQEKLEEWKKMTNHLDKEHAKECKRTKQELKKKSSDTLRLQKKVRKVGVTEIRRTLDYALQDVTDIYLLLEETEKQSVRKALVEERSHFCIFVGCLQPVLESEIKMLNEINHLEEVIVTLSKITSDPYILPPTSEQVILDMKSTSAVWSLQSPPGSPSSLGSRKSSVCSINSINSSSSGSFKYQRQLSYTQHTSTSQHHYNSVASQDSGFASQDTLYMNCNGAYESSQKLSSFSDAKTSTLSTPSSPLPSVTSTWPHLPQETQTFEPQSTQLQKYQRPHTISSAYEKSNHCRPALTAHTFEPLDCIDPRVSNAAIGTFKTKKIKDQIAYRSQPGTPIYSKPSIPERNEVVNKCSPGIPEKSVSVRTKHGSPNKIVPDFNQTPPDQVVPHPVYANTKELGCKVSATSTGDNKEFQSRKDLAAVLTEGLLLQSMKSKNDTLPLPAAVVAKLKNCRPIVGSSETLPRSRESAIEEAEMMQWQMYAMSLYNNSNISFGQLGEPQRPASIAGVAESVPVPRKACTLHRVGSTPGGSKPPPTPVRRSSSITRTNGSSHSISSGGGEGCYSPSFREMLKNGSSAESITSPARSYSPLRSHSLDKSYPREGSLCSSMTDDSDSEQSIVTDVSDSRARLIQDLNSSIGPQKRKPPPRPPMDKPPPAPVRHNSKQDLYENINHFGKSENLQPENYAVYGFGNGGSLDKRGQTFIAKPVLCQDIVMNSHRKTPTKGPEVLPKKTIEQRVYADSVMNHHHDSLQSPTSHTHFKQNFMVSLNSKLAQQQQNNYAPLVAEKQVCQKESLMDQIRRGTTLRRVTCNDRSVPRIA